MKRTRKWAFVAQEAKRLADLGLAPVDIAARLSVKPSTVNRWMAAGKMTDTRRGAGRRQIGPMSTRIVKPSEWATAVRRDFALDATDEQLVTQAETALGISLDPLRPDSTRLQAMGRFQALVKQLALVARLADAPDKHGEKREVQAQMRPAIERPAGDPRALLMAVK